LPYNAAHRMGENDAWQVAIVLDLTGKLVGHDPKAFGQLGAAYVDHRKAWSSRLREPHLPRLHHHTDLVAVLEVAFEDFETERIEQQVLNGTL
jgi:hypothetical protein